MNDGDRAIVDIIGTKGDEFRVAGPQMGDDRIELALKPTGLLDVPVSTIWNETAFGWGARWGGLRYNKRDLVLGFNVLGDTADEWQANNDRFRANWSYTADTVIRVTTDPWGTRELAVRLSKDTDEEMERDPRIRAFSNMVMTCTAGWPFWVQPDDTFEWELTSGTSGTTTFPVVNRTDMPAYLRYSLDGPAKFTVPDFSFGSDEWDRGDIDVARVVPLPTQTSAAKHMTVDSDPTEETIMVDDGSQLWALMKSDLLYPIPPQTGVITPVMLPLSVTNAVPGVAAQVRIPRNYMRPWGLAG